VTRVDFGASVDGAPLLASTGGNATMVWDFSGPGPAGSAPTLAVGHTKVVDCLVRARVGAGAGKRVGPSISWSTQGLLGAPAAPEPPLQAVGGGRLTAALAPRRPRAHTAQAWHPAQPGVLATGGRDGRLIVYEIHNAAEVGPGVGSSCPGAGTPPLARGCSGCRPRRAAARLASVLRRAT
jgi:hypothetical protein